MMFGHTVCTCESKTESVSNSLAKDLLECMNDSRVILNTSVDKNINKAQKHQKSDLIRETSPIKRLQYVKG